MSEEIELTEADQLDILKAVWPDECSLISDQQLSRLVSAQVSVTRPEAGFNFEVGPIFEVLASAINLLAAAIAYRAATLRPPPDRPAEDETAATVQAMLDSADKRAQLDHATITLLATESVRVRRRRNKSN